MICLILLKGIWIPGKAGEVLHIQFLWSMFSLFIAFYLSYFFFFALFIY